MIRSRGKMLGMVAAVVTACAAQTSPSSRAGGWTQVVTDHFVLSSKLPDPHAIDMAQTLEAARGAGDGGVCALRRARASPFSTAQSQRWSSLTASGCSAYVF